MLLPYYAQQLRLTLQLALYYDQTIQRSAPK